MLPNYICNGFSLSFSIKCELINFNHPFYLWYFQRFNCFNYHYFFWHFLTKLCLYRYLFKQLKTTHDLCELVKNVCDNETRTDMLQRPAHPATKVFQALRIFVNNELNEINHSMVLASHYLKIGGTMVTVAFHSLEDTIVKRHIQGNVNENTANTLPLKYISPMQDFDKNFMDTFNESCWHQIHKHVITPSIEEVESNPRSRSARLRAAIRIK